MNVWIFNHYATAMFVDQGGRHYSFAKYLKEFETQSTIFCASTIHNTDGIIEMGENIYKTDEVDNIPFVFIKTPRYKGNGKQRLKNMISFYRNLLLVAEEYAEKRGKPDSILASSVHPLTLVAGIKIAKKFGIPCICEVRDLWPESLVAYGILNKNHILTKLLYKGEKWIYKHADKLIFTFEGGKDYIIERGWDKDSGGPVNLAKVNYINNGVDLDSFHENSEKYKIEDSDLSNDHLFKVVYAGSIRKANNVQKIINIAEIIQKKKNDRIIFLIYGDGTERESLQKYCRENGINNIKFKGVISKKNIPYVLKKSDLNVVQLFEKNDLKKYGTSMNKLFEYFASGKPTISDCKYGYDLIKKYNCGLVTDNATPEQIAENIIQFSQISQEDYETYSRNALKAAQDFDFKVLTKRLDQIIRK